MCKRIRAPPNELEPETIMSDTELWEALRTKIRKVPFERRRVWTDAELIGWWSDIHRTVASGTPRGAPLTFATVKRMCGDLIGKHALK